MKDKTTLNDSQLEQWLKQDLPSDRPANALLEKLQRIPEQFPQAANIVGRESIYESSHAPAHQSRWLYALLATAASVVGILAGSLDILAVMPEQNLLTALLYGTADLNGIIL